MNMLMNKKNKSQFEEKFSNFLDDVGYVKSWSHFDVVQALRKKPDVVIDVGVDYGTPWLYDLYPDAKFILIDPQRDAEKQLQEKPRHYVYVNKAVGAEKGKLKLEQKRNRAKSTLMQSTPLTSKKIGAKVTDQYEVEVTTLDSIIDDLKIEGEIGLKIDTEGYEIEVIKGLDKHKDKVSFIMAEVSVRDRFYNSYNFSELVSEFYTRGFRFYNIANPASLKAPRFYDCIFLRHDDDLFKSGKDVKKKK